ncbi:MAG: Cadherin-like beta sandwich domain protein [Candidatus Solibacter sp.]|nr:Cadherin-like beta sandwich domain protein [Candidatus Solibacter sp.]
MHHLCSLLVVLGLSLPATAQFIQQGKTLVGSGNLGNAGQGYAVALSADGNTALVGGSQDDTSAPGIPRGAAWVFTRSGDVWSQQGQKLVGSGPSMLQGYAVALSADGNTAVISGGELNGSAADLWFFTRAAGIWSQQGTKVVVPASGIFTKLALSADGNTLVVSSRGGTLAVVVMARSGGVWTQQSVLAGTGVIGDSWDVSFGNAVAISGDGNTIAVSGPGDNKRTGATWIFVRANGQWIQQGQKLVGSGFIGEGFEGVAVSLSSDGNTLAVTGEIGGPKAGAIWFFTRTAGVWSQQGGKVTKSEDINDGTFGLTVSLSGDGNTAFVSGYPLGYPGVLWIFGRTDGVWTQRGPMFYGTTGPDNVLQCWGGAISADGNTLIAGIPQVYTATGSDSGVGGAWIFVRNTLQFTVPPDVVAGLPISIGVSAVKPNNVVSSGYYGSLSLSSSDAHAVLPQGSTLSDSHGAFIATFKTPGLQTISASYVPTPLVVGTTNLIPVRAAAIELAPLDLTLQYNLGSDPSTAVPGTIKVTANAPIAFTATASDSWITVSPSSGTAPATLLVRPNPAGLMPGSQSTRITLAFADGRLFAVRVTLEVAGVTAFANAASFAPGPAAPNTLLAAFGNFPGCTSDARVSIDHADTTVFASSSTQINFLLPAAVSDQQSAGVQITCAGASFPIVSLPVIPAAPALLTASQTGAGEAAIVNEDGSVNTPSPAGTIVTLYGTGFGLLGNASPDGLAHTVLPVSASVGGKAATVLYAGEAPGYTPGLQQINVLIPPDAPTGPSVLLRLVVGGINTQDGVTLAIQ